MEKISNQEVQNGWKDVTETHAETVAKFYSENGFWSPDKPLKYKHSSESSIETSGGSSKMAEIKKGTLLPSEVKIYFESGQPKRLHAYFDGLDVYFTGQVVKDYLDQVNFQ